MAVAVVRPTIAQENEDSPKPLRPSQQTAVDEVERLLYGWSVLHCLPVGMAEQPSAATGTVMRAETLRQYAREAGFSDVEILPIENDFWRFYRLTP